MKARKVELEVHVDTADAEAAIEDLLDLVRELRAELAALRQETPPTVPSYPIPSYPLPQVTTCGLCGAWYYGVHTCWTYRPNTWPY